MCLLCDARISRVYTIDVGIDITPIRLQRRGQCNRRSIRSAAAERGNPVRLRNPLKPCNNGDLTLVNRVA